MRADPVLNVDIGAKSLAHYSEPMLIINHFGRCVTQKMLAKSHNITINFAICQPKKIGANIFALVPSSITLAAIKIAFRPLNIRSAGDEGGNRKKNYRSRCGICKCNGSNIIDMGEK